MLAAPVPRFQTIWTTAEPPAALFRHACTAFCTCASTALVHLARLKRAPGWVQRREELRQRLQLDKVLAPELEAQAAERDALAAQQQASVLCCSIQGPLCCLSSLWTDLCLSCGAGFGAIQPGSTAECQDLVHASTGTLILTDGRDGCRG